MPARCRRGRGGVKFATLDNEPGGDQNRTVVPVLDRKVECILDGCAGANHITEELVVGMMNRAAEMGIGIEDPRFPVVRLERRVHPKFPCLKGAVVLRVTQAEHRDLCPAQDCSQRHFGLACGRALDCAGRGSPARPSPCSAHGVVVRQPRGPEPTCSPQVREHRGPQGAISPVGGLRGHFRLRGKVALGLSNGENCFSQLAAKIRACFQGLAGRVQATALAVPSASASAKNLPTSSVVVAMGSSAKTPNRRNQGPFQGSNRVHHCGRKPTPNDKTPMADAEAPGSCRR